jgi:5-formyltetrahydrofolate cyclo-ligase
MKARLKALPKDELSRDGAAAARRLREAPCWGQYATILSFLSMSTEIDTIPLLEAAFGDQKRVFAPKVEGERLRFCRIRRAQGPWQEGPFGIREPPDPAPEDILKPGDFPALIIVPALAFDPAGNRLGRGRGYYDRFFAETAGPGLRLGFCVDFQVLPQVPADAWDVRMDALCTEKRLIWRPSAWRPASSVVAEGPKGPVQ